MNKSSVVAAFIEYQVKDIPTDENGNIDPEEKRRAWFEYLDYLLEEEHITETQHDTWVCPF